MSVAIATLGMFNPSIGTAAIAPSPAGGGGSGGIRYIDKDITRPIVMVSRVRYEEEEEIIVTVTAVKE